jgi:N-methylhydantoinase A
MSNRQGIRVATDVGGTFTDLVSLEIDAATGRQVVKVAKTDTTPPNFEKGVLDVLHKANIGLADVGFLVHGTTVVINALTERKGAKTGLITTEGFRDVLEIARGNRPDFFNLRYVKPPPFVPRHLRRELPGRISFKGEELVPLDMTGLPEILDDFRAAGVEAVSVCFMHAYADSSHEERAVAEIKRLWPSVSVVASHQITREWREYERTNTTVLSAYVQPVAAKYLRGIQRELVGAGFKGSLYIMQSNCGVETLESVSETPITMVESGPASGFWGAAELGRLIGEGNVLALDIGGTTAKCSLIEHGQVKMTSDYWIERTRVNAGYPIMVPVIDLVEIGNGGGSIAWIDDLGKLHVGPQSAGAMPGPAAYGRGGRHATTTDANLALGRINRDYFCGGEMEADMGAVDAALDELAGPLKMSRQEVARGIVRIANNNMINALKLVSLNRGYDPRDFTMIAFGGGGGMHGAALASELGLKKVVVPAAASVFSAWGMLMSDLRRDYIVTRVLDFAAESAGAVDALIGEIEARAVAKFAGETIDRARVRFAVYARLRYQNQEHSVEVPVPEGPFDAAAWTATVERFHDIYQRHYTYRLDAPVEFVGLHIVASAEVGKLAVAERPVTGLKLADTIKGRRQVDYALEGIHQATIYDGDRLEPGMGFAGPAIIEQPGATTVVHPNQSVSIDRYGNIHIDVTAATGG